MPPAGLSTMIKTMEADEIKLPLQVNGKVKAVLEVPKDLSKEEILAKAKECLGDKLGGTLVKEVYIPGKIVNFVVK